MKIQKTLPVLLAGLLQVMPMLRAVLPVTKQAFVPSTWAIVFKLASGAVAMFGYHAISSASNVVPNGGTFNLTVGTPFSQTFTFSGSHTPKDFTITSGSIPTGLTYTDGRSYGLINGTPTAAGNWQCVIKAWENYPTGGSSIGATFYFNVTGSGSPPVITNIVVSPSASVSPGTAVTFTPTIGGTGPFRYRWRFNGANVFGGTNMTLTVNNAQSTNAGTYSLVVMSLFGAATNSVSLAVNGPPAITGQPQDQAVAAGGTATFTVSAGGAATLGYQWRKEGVPLPGQTSPTLTLPSVQTANAGRYSVVVSNALGTVTSGDAFLRLSPSSVTANVPIFGLNYAWRYNTNGLDLGVDWREFDYVDTSWPSGPGILAKEDSGNPTVLTNIGTTLPTSSSHGFITNFYFRTHFTITNKAQVSSLVFSNVVDDGAVYYLNGVEIIRSTNMPAGTITANTLALVAQQEGVFTVSNVAPTYLVQGDNVVAVEVHQVNNTSSDIVMGMALFGTFVTPNTVPLILTNPVGSTVNSGNNVSLTAAANGTAPMTLRWFKDGVLVPGATGSTLNLTSVQSANAGAYTFMASNAFGTATSLVANLTVIDTSPPTITAPPASQIVPAGANVTFTVAASGSGLGYQWQFNNSDLTGATAVSLNLTNVSPAQSGSYSVVVRNGVGSVPSTNAQLLVVPPPTPAVAPQFNPLGLVPGSFNLSFSTTAGYRYLLEYTENLGTTNWITLSNIPPSFSSVSINFPQNSSSALQRFYRVSVSSN